MSTLIISDCKFKYVLCELHYSPIHGKTQSSCPNIDGHFLIIDVFDGSSGIILNELENYNEYDTDHECSLDTDGEEEDEEDEQDIVTHISNIQTLHSSHYEELIINRNFYHIPHKTIRNYHNIISRPNYIRPEIAQCILLPTLEHIAIIKTIWIRIIQRKWKCVFIERKKITQYRCCSSSLSTRQATGFWPKHCEILPGIKGMLSDLSK